MWLIALKGLAGSGKSTLGRALSKQLGWPLIDKDDIKDLLDAHTPEAGGLAYDIMFNVARRQLRQGLNVICDSPLTNSRAYEHALAIASETHASLAVIECRCSDEEQWKQRMDARKELQLPSHHQTDWDAFQQMRRSLYSQANYSLTVPYLLVDSARPPEDCLAEVTCWLEQLFRQCPQQADWESSQKFTVQTRHSCALFS